MALKHLILITLCYTALVGPSLGQTQNSLNVTSTIENDASSDSVEVANDPSSLIKIIVRRVIVDSTNGNDNTLAWKDCFQAFPNSSSTSSADTGSSDQKAPRLSIGKGTMGKCRIQYCFYNKTNSVDSICETVAYTTDVSRLIGQDFEKTGPSLDEEPQVTQSIIVIHKVNSEAIRLIMLNDLKGGIIKESSQTEFDVSEVRPGVYFCVVILDSGTTISRKIVIQ
ncbi:MAG: T9SS type A sorting domain-containing protein [Flavobacteriales bacterium]|nr:T9SS type A sorting domain-containing protein [Flavobacteriales bacterium]